ncbi:MAG: ThiF family adenylyltransferase [Gammaproteobacteria bacterium]|nr:ThiF family adenylyltransferase [Gammaproteobacteria bacterium]
MENAATEFNREEFYKEFTLRNAGFICDADQKRLRESVILIAGCGSTGGSVIELLVRSGAENLILVDNGRYDLNNANRQNMVLDDVDRYKPIVFQERCQAINPFVKIEVCNIGITPDNVDDFVSRADVVVDAVDVTGRSGLEMKFLLHEVCHVKNKAVICGYDMAATQYIPIFDYRNPDLPLFDNQINANMVATMDPLKVCTFLVPISEIPEAMFEELERHTQGKDYTSQLGIAANLFGTITTALVIDILSGRSVKNEYTIDVWKVIRGEYEDKEKLAEYRKGIEAWQNEPCNIEDNEFLSRSLKHYSVPFLPELLPENLTQPHLKIKSSENLISVAIRNGDLADKHKQQLLRYAFVHYAKVGFINQDTAAKDLLHHEPLTALQEDDVHILVLDKTLGKLMAYSTLKMMPESNKTFSEAQRPEYSVEKAFGRETFSNISDLAGLQLSEIREIGRVVKTYTEDKTMSARVGLMLLDAYHALITQQDSGIKAMIGDGEAKVTLANLDMYGFNPVVLQKSNVVIDPEHLFASRYQGREVKPFWFALSQMDKEKNQQASQLLNLAENEFYSAYKKFKNSEPLTIQPQTELA